ncbi:MAG: anthranilate synthase component I [Candidatus Kryptoniota bacterium]
MDTVIDRNTLREKLYQAAEQGYTHYPVITELFYDLDTPVSLYKKLRQLGKKSFLLESAEGGQHVGRYSFIGINPVGTFIAKDWTTTIQWKDEKDTFHGDPFELLKSQLQKYRVAPVTSLPRLVGGAVGYFGYDSIKYIEEIKLPPADTATPDIYLNFYETVVAVDNLRRRILVVNLVPLNADRNNLDKLLDERIFQTTEIIKSLNEPAPLNNRAFNKTTEVHIPTSRDDFLNEVRRAKNYIIEGDIFQVVLSQRAEFKYEGDPFILYRAVRALNPSPYMFYLEDSSESDVYVIGSSPEMFVRKEGRTVETRPIAGTRKRGLSEEEDAALEHELITDEKERAEHVMLVDLGRNDIGRVAEPGSVAVHDFMHIEKFSHVMHIVTRITGRTQENYDAVDTLKACFPAGTLSGAPKVRAMQIISELEHLARGVYGGAVGYIDFNGNMDTCIAIRTFVLNKGKAYLQAGAGIVYDSDPDKEFDESINKMRANLEALEIISKFNTGTSADFVL